ncbi:MAG: hypothetical protein ACJ798_06695 [Phenylobacterium sp.]
MVMARRVAKRTYRTLAVAGSLAAHLGFVVFLVWRLGATPYLSEQPAIQVELVRRPHAVRERSPATAKTGSVAPAPPSLHVLSHPTSPTPQTKALPEAEALDANVGARQALRGRFGCDHARMLGLSAEERADCEDRIARAAPFSGAGRLNLDLTGRYAADPEPYLARRPKNGCKVRAAGDAGPMGNEGPAAGIACAWSF